MAKIYDKPISIQRTNEVTEEWEDVYKVHAHVNKSKSNDEYLNGGAEQGKINLVFEVRFFENLKDIASNTQLYRIVYDGVPYNIKDYDDYMLQHKTVKLLGASY